MWEVNRVILDVPALVAVLDEHPDVFVPGHVPRLAIGEA